MPRFGGMIEYIKVTICSVSENVATMYRNTVMRRLYKSLFFITEIQEIRLAGRDISSAIGYSNGTTSHIAQFDPHMCVGTMISNIQNNSCSQM